MSTLTTDTEDFYVCAGICRVDYQTNTCIGCGRPVIETPEEADTAKKPDIPPEEVGETADAAQDSSA